MAVTTGGSVYESYIAEQVAREDLRKTSIESRGLAVITTSGALATLLLGFITLIGQDETGVQLPASAHDWIRAALILFATAGGLALLTRLVLEVSAN